MGQKSTICREAYIRTSLKNKREEAAIFQGKIDAQVVVVCFEAFSRNLTKPTWIILDNAAQHTTHLFKVYPPHWE